MNEVNEQVDGYVEEQLNCKVVRSWPEVTIRDMGYEITIWNIKTDAVGSWWVATGGGLPMNLYSQDEPVYFSTDEVFSFHIGLMMRSIYDKETKAEHVIDFLSGRLELAMEIRRKLELAAEKLNDLTEIEDFQAIGVICREVLIKLIKDISKSKNFIIDFESLKMANFKGRVEKIISTISPGEGNKLLRKTIKDLAFEVWDFSNKLTHSSSMTKHDAGICLTLCTAFVTAIEHLSLKYFDILSDEKCEMCGSKKLFSAENDGDNDIILVICEKCNHGHPKDLSKLN